MGGQLLCEREELTREHWMILGFTWAGWLFDFYDLILYSFLLIPIMAEWGISRVEAGIIYGFSLVATAIGGIVFGVLSDKYGRRTMLQASILTYSIGTFLCGTSMNLYQLLVWRALTGFGAGGQWAIGQTLVCETWPKEKRGKGAAIMQSGAPLGVALACLIGGFIAPMIGWRLTFMLSATPALLVALIRKGMPESDLWLKFREEFKSKTLPKKVKAKLGRAPIIQIFDRDILPWTVRGLVLAVFGMLSYWVVYAWLPDFLHSEMHFEMSKTGIWMFISQMGALLGYLSFGYFSDRIGRKPSFIMYSMTQALGVVTLIMVVDQIMANPYIALPPLFLIGFGTGFFSGYGPIYSEIFPTHVRNTATGFCFNTARGISFIAPVVVAVLSGTYGLAGGLSLAALFNILLALWILTFPETKGKMLEIIEYIID